MIKLIIAVLVILILRYMYKEWKKLKRTDSYEERLEDIENSIEDIGFENKIVDFEDKLNKEKGKLQEKINAAKNGK